MGSKYLIDLYKQSFGNLPDNFISLKGDGSDRQIFRLQDLKRSVIGIVGNNHTENRAFIHFSNHFRKFGLPVPEIYAEDSKNGVYLETDLGDVTLYNKICDFSEKGFTDELTGLYKKVLEWLPKFQIVAGESLDYTYCYQYETFASDAILHDLQYFHERFLKVFYKKPFNNNNLYNEFNDLIKVLLLEKHDYFLYRDFQSRNIMLIENQPWFIDYQSGRRGALQYDVASLLYDAKASIPEEIKTGLLKFYMSEIAKLIQINQDTFIFYYYAYVWVRIMQALGAYGFLSLVKGKKSFLKNIPLSLNNIELLLKKSTIIDFLPELKKIFFELVNDHKLRNLQKDE